MKELTHKATLRTFKFRVFLYVHFDYLDIAFSFCFFGMVGIVLFLQILVKAGATPPKNDSIILAVSRTVFARTIKWPNYVKYRSNYVTLVYNLFHSGDTCWGFVQTPLQFLICRLFIGL